MQPPDAHLNDEGFARLLANEVEPELWEHLFHCEPCSQRLRGLMGMREPAESASPAPGPNCPRPEVWWTVAADPDKNADSLLQHAAECEFCAREWKAALEQSSLEEPFHEMSRLDSPAARADLGKRMAQLARPKRRAPVAIYGAIAAALVLGILGVWRFLNSRSPDNLIARAYEDKRSIEFRLPGASYVPIRVERGAPQEASRTISLLDAESITARNVARSPANPLYLRQQARVELLRWDYASALRRLSRAADARPDDPEVLRDLALAYFERGQKENRPADHGAAVEALGKVLGRRPDDTVALFNRAIALEQLMLYREAAEDWKHFLRLEPRGGWADEAHERLAGIEKKISLRDRIRPCGELTAQMVVDWQSSGRLAEEIDRFEEGWGCLRERALIDWLPSIQLADLNRQAVMRTSEAFFAETGDTWFRDLLATSADPRFEAAAKDLGEAIAANNSLNTGRAETAAPKAEQLFRQIGNEAGAVQAAIEHDYAIRRSQQAAECRAILEPVERRIGNRPWRWVALQARMEWAVCLNMGGDPGASQRLSREAIELSRGRAFAGLHLRALSYVEASEVIASQLDSAWAHAAEGLSTFWAGQGAPVWGYQLYYHLTRAANAARRPLLALHLQKETLSQIQRSHRPSMEAFTWFDYGRSAMTAESWDEARQAFERATTIFGGLPRDRGIETMLADCQVYLAELDVHLGNAKAAVDRLDGVAQQMENGNSFPMELAYRRARVAADRHLASPRYSRDLDQLIGTSQRTFATLSAYQQQIDWARDNADSYREYAAYRMREKGEAQGLDSWELFRSAPFLQAPEASTADTLGRLGIGQAIVYMDMEDRLTIWVIRHRTVEARAVSVKRTDLERMARRLYLLCSDPESDRSALDAAARDLSGLMIAPIEDLIVWDEPVWVELDDSLKSVPFPVLPLRTKDPLGTRCPVSIFPGVEYLGHASAVRPFSPSEPALAVGVSSLNEPGFVPLPHAIRETQSVALRFPAARLLLNDDATAANVKREISGSVVFHFAGHIRTASDKFSLLVAGDRGENELGAQEIAAMDLKQCRLVVISGCAAESPNFFEKSEHFGFADVLLRRGVPGVLDTRWDLDSKSAQEFMSVFYERLARGEEGIRATFEAARQLRKAQATGHPYYWAAYQFFGLG